MIEYVIAQSPLIFFADGAKVLPSISMSTTQHNSMQTRAKVEIVFHVDVHTDVALGYAYEL